MKHSGHSNNITIISKETTINAQIESPGKVHVMGQLKGNITSTIEIIIAQSGSINGSLLSDEITISGKVEGDVRARKRLTLTPTAFVSGNIYAKALITENGAEINGRLATGKDADILANPIREKTGIENIPIQKKAG